MTVTPKKVCFLHLSCSPHSSTRPNCLYNLCSKSGQKNGKEFDLLQVPTRKNSGKKPDPEIPGKIRFPNFWYLMSDFHKGQQNVLFHEAIKNFSCYFHQFWQFWHEDFSAYTCEFWKNRLVIYFLVSCDS